MKLIEKLKFLAKVYGGRDGSDLIYMFTIIIVWTLLLIPRYPGWFGGFLGIFLLVFIVSKLFLIMERAGIFEKAKKDRRGF